MDNRDFDKEELKEVKTTSEQDEQMRYLKHNQQVQYLFDIMKGDKNEF